MADDTKLALVFVQQWLYESGYTEALQALQREAGLVYDDAKLPKSSQLMQLVWRYMEDALAPAEAPEDAGQRAEEEAMLRGGRNDYCKEVTKSIEGVHSSNLVAVRIVPGAERVLTGAGDGFVRSISFDGAVQWQAGVGSGGVLCLDLQPTSSSGSSQGEASTASDGNAASTSSQAPLLAAGSMDGTLSLLDSSTGQLLGSDRSHTKYLVRVTWCGKGEKVITCSHDQTVGVHEVTIGDQEGFRTASVKTIKRLEYTAQVQDCVVLHDGVTLVVAVRGSNYLRVLRLHDLEAPEELVNLNATGDDHVSFFARHLLPSPCGRFLLVSTDTGRLLVLRTGSWVHCPFPFFTLHTQQFHQFSAVWHRDSMYVYAGAAGGAVWVYHVGSGKVVAKLPVHKVNVRDMHYDAERNILATCSFDKTVKLLTVSQQ